MKDVVLADRMGSMGESVTLRLTAHAKQLAAEGKTVYNLTAGELASDTPDYIQKAVAEKLQHNKYSPAAGLPSGSSCPKWTCAGSGEAVTGIQIS